MELQTYHPIKDEIFHVHTFRCGHAEAVPDRKYVEKAIELGAPRIVFTDHAPFPGNPFGNRMNIEDLPEYVEAMNELKAGFAGKIEILAGLEAEYLPGFHKYLCSLKKEYSYYDEECENKQYFELRYRDIWDIVWKSQFRHDAETRGIDVYKDYDYTFITGYVPVMNILREYEQESNFNELRIYEKGNLIDIDGACGLGYHPGLHNGVLFLRLDDMKVFPIYLENIY